MNGGLLRPLRMGTGPQEEGARIRLPEEADGRTFVASGDSASNPEKLHRTTDLDVGDGRVTYGHRKQSDCNQSDRNGHNLELSRNSDMDRRHNIGGRGGSFPELR